MTILGRRLKWVFIPSGTFLAALGFWIWLTTPLSTPTMRGQILANELACFTCHGLGGSQAVSNPGSDFGEIPRWDQDYKSMFIEDERDIASWILHGRPGVYEQPQAGMVAVPPGKGAVPMPRYAGRITQSQLEDLTAYYRAVAAYQPELSPEAREGRKTADRRGCFSCHGPGGMGGFPNPGSFKGIIPPWNGKDYSHLVENEGELREWILDGHIQRFERNPFARFFLNRQLVAMPAYREHLTTGEVDSIVTYITELRQNPQ